MATMQVPGYLPENQDRLHNQCWAEQPGKLLVMKDVTPKEVAYQVRDNVRVLEDKRIPVLDFQKSFSDAGWLWHDKTPVPIAA